MIRLLTIEAGMETEAAICDALRRLGLLAGPAQPEVTRLTGGVSCDIFRVDLENGPVCVKRALAQLRVSADWKAPVERSRSEVQWLRLAEALGRPKTPHVLADSASDNLFVMSFLPPDRYTNWKVELAAGRVDIDVAATVGRDIAHIHAATAYSAEAARNFANGALFSALRIEPYLLHAAARHPDLAERLAALAEETLDTEIALVHGDVSPKNILIGPDGPVFLDAECAWYGDPAFDLAFCLSHLLLKCVWRPDHRANYLKAFDALTHAYLDGVRWEPRAGLAQRSGALLAALLLARVDGKSPAEYLVDPSDIDFVRRVSREVVAKDGIGVEEVAWTWADRLEER